MIPGEYFKFKAGATAPALSLFFMEVKYQEQAYCELLSSNLSSCFISCSASAMFFVPVQMPV